MLGKAGVNRETLEGGHQAEMLAGTTRPTAPAAKREGGENVPISCQYYQGCRHVTQYIDNTTKLFH